MSDACDLPSCEHEGCSAEPRHRAVLFVRLAGKPVTQEPIRFVLASWVCDQHQPDMTKRRLFDNRRWRALQEILRSSYGHDPDWKATTLAWE